MTLANKDFLKGGPLNLVNGEGLVTNFYDDYPRPLWVQVDTLGLGDILVVKSQTTYYYLVVVGSRAALLMTNKSADQPIEVHIYGGYDLEAGQPSMGKIQVGVPFLFAPISNLSEAIKTSLVETIYLRKVLGASGSFVGSGAGVKSLTPKLGVGVGATPRVLKTGALPLKPLQKPLGVGGSQPVKLGRPNFAPL